MVQKQVLTSLEQQSCNMELSAMRFCSMAFILILLVLNSLSGIFFSWRNFLLLFKRLFVRT